MHRRGVRTVVWALLLCACTQSGNGSNNNGNRPPAPTIQTDSTVTPSVTTVAGVNGGPARAVGAVQGPSGKKSDLVMDELMVVTDQKSKVDALAARWKGTIESSAAFDVIGTTDFKMYLVQIDPSGVDVSSLGTKLQSIDPLAQGAHKVSSDRVMQLLAVATQEALADPSLSVGINPLLVPQGIWEGSTTEGSPPDSSVGTDPFTWPHMLIHQVPAAWQALQETVKLGNRVRVLILDGGFVKNPDLPASTVMVGSWSTPNPATCTGGTPCLWHGTAVASTLAGTLDNAYGGAGTGAPVVDVTVVQSPSADVFQYIGYALNVLGELLSGPQIVNISATTSWPGALGFMVKPLDNIVTLIRGKTFGPVQIRFAPGALVFVAAGNDGEDVDDETCFIGCWETEVILPCELDDAVCVAGLKYGTRYADPSSNWGRHQRRRGDGSDSWTYQDNSVDFYAPFKVIVGPDPDSSGNIQGSAGRWDSGTSFSSPFAAGIAALVWAADPTLNADQVFEILLDTADSTPGGDGLVINALAAVKKALSKQNNPPAIRITAPADGASTTVGLPGVSFIAEAKDLEDGNACCQITWSSDVEGNLGTGVSPTFQFQQLGAQVITATAHDSQGATSSAQVHITVSDIPPVVSIVTPGSSDTIYQARPFNVLGRAFEGLSDLCQAPNPTSNISWSSNDASDGFIGPGCGQIYIAGSTGQRTLTFTARDQYGTSASVAMVVNVQPTPAAPVVSISSPAPNSSAYAGSTISLGALVTGGQAPLTFQWTWKSPNAGCTETNINPTQNSGPPQVTATWDSSTLASGCNTGMGTITLYATDAFNQVGSGSVAFDFFIVN